MEHDNVADGSCDRRLLAEPPGTPTHSSPSFSLRRRAREPVFNSDPARFPNAGIPDRSGKASQPTQPQERALLSLARFSPWKVAAWVEILRSLAPGYQHVGRLAPLTPLELNAVHELKDCEEDWLLAWLNIAAQYQVKQPSSPAQSSPLESIASPRGSSPTSQPAFSTPARASVSSLHPSSAFSRRTVQSTLPSSLSSTTSYYQPSAAYQGSPTSSKTGDHLHWCNICENPKEIETCDGYKRHMREHETIYQCMPNGPVKPTEAGTECYFCGASNPDQSHLDKHHVTKCSGQFVKCQSYTREVNLSHHIKKDHNASENYASALAKAWRDGNKNKKMFFSCGFCICHFPTLKEQIGHIHGKHWSQHQEPKEWDKNKVILGLLLQPDVKEAWQQLLMSDPKLDPRHNPAPQWDPSVVGHVQLQLETRVDSAAALAQLAFDKSSYYSVDQANISNSTLQPYYEDVDMFGHPPIEQKTMSRTQLPNEEFLQIPGDPSIIDNRRRVSHRHRNNSYHGCAPGFAQIQAEIPNGRLPSTTGVYEDVAINLQQTTGFHDHSNLFDLGSSGGTMGDMFESEAPSSSPWNPYTASQRPVLTQDPMGFEVPSDIQVRCDAFLGELHTDIASDDPTDQRETYLQQYDSTMMETLSSSVDEGTQIIPSRPRARRKSGRPIVTGGSKRKPSSSPTGESRWDPELNPIVVEMGRGSVHQDRFRSRKRIEGYNSHD